MKKVLDHQKLLYILKIICAKLMNFYQYNFLTCNLKIEKT